MEQLQAGSPIEGGIQHRGEKELGEYIDHIRAVMEQSRTYGHLSADRILLGSTPIPVSLRQAVSIQVALQRKLQDKLPPWFRAHGYVPHALNLEQSSSQATAQYKQRFVSASDTVADLTGGLGVDFVALLQVARAGLYNDRDFHLYVAAHYNLPRVIDTEKHPIQLCHEQAQELLNKVSQPPFSLIYLDPARRNSHGARVYQLADTHPNPVELLQELYQRGFGGRFLLKVSPMADTYSLPEQLPTTHEIHLVAHRGELKEILLYGGPTTPPNDLCRVYVTQVDDHGAPYQSWHYSLHRHHHTPEPPIVASQLHTYLYIPHAAMMKSGAFGRLSRSLQTPVLSANSHLYTTSQRLNSFPGREYRILQVWPYNKRTINQLRKTPLEASITTRNFPVSATTLKQKLRNQEHNRHLLVATTDASNQRILILCTSTEE